MPLIAQAEFFLVDVSATSLDSLIVDAFERWKDSSPLKICLRFYDDDGLILRFAQQAERLDATSKKLLDRWVPARGLKRWWLNKRCRWVDGSRARLKARASAAAIRKAEQILRDRLPAAVELRDHRYALVADDERHELIESLRHAKSSWLFVFEPSQLCFEKNSLIASLM